jgi:hypothetical protein
MNELTKRGEAFENRFAHEEGLRFKVFARRNRLVGLWAAHQLGKSGADAEAYASRIVLADLEEPGDDDVIRKIIADFEAANVAVQESDVRRVLDEQMTVATNEVKAGR